MSNKQKSSEKRKAVQKAVEEVKAPVYTLEQLQAHAYQCLVNINAWQRDLNATEAEIAKLQAKK